MATRKRGLVSGSLWSALLVLVATRATGAADGDTCEVLVLGIDRVAVGTRTMNRSALLVLLARFADGDRNDATANRISNRQLVVRAAPKTPWSEVRPFLLTAIDPAVRIHRLAIAETGGKTVPVTVLPAWLPDAEGGRGRWKPEAHLEVELSRKPGETQHRVKLLDSQLGSGDQAVGKLIDRARRIRATEEYRGIPAQVDAWGAVPFSEVLRMIALLRTEGYPRVQLECLVPGEEASPGEWSGDLRTEAAKLAGAERVKLLLDVLWSPYPAGAGELLREEGACAIAAVLSRLADDGLPKPEQETSEAAPSAAEEDWVAGYLSSFGEQAVPILLEATGSPSALVRRLVTRSLGQFQPMTPKAREALFRLKERDPDLRVRQAAKQALAPERPGPPVRERD